MRLPRFITLLVLRIKIRSWPMALKEISEDMLQQTAQNPSLDRQRPKRGDRRDVSGSFDFSLLSRNTGERPVCPRAARSQKWD
jgi:hypothetical protein